MEDLVLENADTVAGSAQHRQVDKPSALPEDPKELELPEGPCLRSLQLESETLGLVGKIDVVEGTSEGIEVIDHKKGSAMREGFGGNHRMHKDRLACRARVSFRVIHTAWRVIGRSGRCIVHGCMASLF